MKNFAKLKVAGVGKFELKNIDDLNMVVRDINLKFRGK